MGCCGQCTHSHPEHVCFVWNISLYFHLWRNWHFSRIIDYMKLMKYWQHWKVPSHPFNAYITWHQIWVVPSDIYRQHCCDRWCHSAQGGATVHNQRWLTLVANLYEHRILWWIFHLQGTDYNGRHLQQVWLPGPRLHYIFWVVSLATYCGDWRQMLPLICMEKKYWKFALYYSEQHQSSPVISFLVFIASLWFVFFPFLDMLNQEFSQSPSPAPLGCPTDSYWSDSFNETHAVC